MTQFVVVQPNQTAVFLVPDFADQAEAQAFATDKGIGGLVIPEAVFAVSPFSVALELTEAKALKIRELTQEGDRRSRLVDPHFFSVNNGFTVGLTVNAVTPLGSSWVAVGVAWDDARAVINALGDVAAVAAYDVVTDPAWP